MEQNIDLKEQMQQELSGLQQHIEQHSTFRSDVWRRSVERHARRLRRINIASAIILIGFMIIWAVVFLNDHYTPWWAVVLIEAYFGYIVVDALLASRGMRHLRNREEVRTLRENIDRSKKNNIYKKALLSIVGVLLLGIIIFIALRAGQPAIEILLPIVVSAIIGPLTLRPLNRSHRELSDEVDELLKED